MKIYVASSWRNPYQQDVVRELRDTGFTVYDFKDSDGFKWSDIDPDWEKWTPNQYRDNLYHPLAMRGFDRDLEALDRADAVVLVLPCGRSAHLELGWALGRGKPGLVLMLDQQEPELMNKMATEVCLTITEVIAALKTVEKEKK